MEAWSKTASTTSTGRPMDGLICPVAASAGIPHDFPLWWGYTSLFNLIDYPSIVLPLKKVRINAEQDAKDENYVPKSNPFDVANHDLLLTSIDDVEKWKNQPVTLQIVTRPYQDEELIAISEVIDNVCNEN
jgi:amidase